MIKLRGAITVFVFVSVLVLKTGIVIAEDTTDDDWVTSSGNTYVTDGNVGIGTTEPVGFGSGSSGPFLNIYSASSTPETYVGSGLTTANSYIGTYGFATSGTSATEKRSALIASQLESLSTSAVTGNIQFWTNNEGDISEKMRITSSGNVGIGTIDPKQLLHVYKGSAGGNYYGQATPVAVFENSGDSYIEVIGSSGNISGLFLGDGTHNSAGGLTYNHSIGRLNFRVNGDATKDMVLTSSGNVGIGTVTPENKLDVKGTIRAEEVKVETGWSDFVFENAYDLPELSEIESYIKDNKHLPDIPSAKEIKEKGLSMAEMMAKQMQKIEELTLYVIEMKKENTELRDELTEINQRLQEIESH